MADNWSPAGSATRVTRDILPALTATEKRYWEETGIIMPIVVGQGAASNIQPPCSYGGSQYYQPFGRMNVIGGTGTGFRVDLSFPNEFAAQAWTNGTAAEWSLAKLFSVSVASSPWTPMLDEATGRIPALNNGPPGGGGYGVGTSYAQLGAPQPTFSAQENVDYAPALQGVPNSVQDWTAAIWPFNYWNGSDHQPNWQGFTYLVYGSRHWLDLIYYQGNRLYTGLDVGPAVGARNDNLSGTTNMYYGLYLLCCEGRGSARAIWDRAIAAAVGGDNNIERSYFNDIITENGNYYPKWQAWKDGTGSTAFRTGLCPPNFIGGCFEADVFIFNYTLDTAYALSTYLHAPLGIGWNQEGQKYFEGLLGEQMAGHPVSYYIINYSGSPDAHSDNNISGGNIGQYMNCCDGSDWGDFSGTANLLAGATIKQVGTGFIMAGGTIKWANQVAECCSGFNLDQVPGNSWSTTINADNSAFTYQVVCPIGHAVDSTCPTPGAAYTEFTRNGTGPVIENTDYVFLRPLGDPGAGGGFSDPNYVGYAENTLNGLQILGHDVSHAQAVYNLRQNPSMNGYGYVGPSQDWDTTIVVPGLPAVVTFGNQFPTLACGAAPGTVVSSLALTQGNGNAAFELVGVVDKFRYDALRDQRE